MKVTVGSHPEIATLKFGLRCDKCNEPCLGGNSALSLERHNHPSCAAIALASKDRHVLPVIIDGKIVCEGSPSRAQYLHGMPSDIRFQYPIDTQTSFGMHMRIAFREAWLGSKRPPEAFKDRQSPVQCPICDQAMHSAMLIGVINEGFVSVLDCPTCSSPDEPKFVLSPYHEEGKPSSQTLLISDRDAALMGGKNLITIMGHPDK